MKKFLLAALIAGSVATATSASAQTPILLETYGRGVHAYFSHQNARAQQLLTEAIAGGLEDPRAYYFRGIAAAEAGNQFQAEADWSIGAELEAAGKIVGPIGPALTRIQGPQRLKMEEIRRESMLRALAISQARSKARYGEITDAAPDVLRSAPAPTVLPPAPPVAPAASSDPFAGDGAGDAAVESRNALEGALEDPFADDLAPPAGGNAGNADQPAADPFGGDAPAAADPFGAPAAGDDPFGGGGDPFGDDPFGGDPFN